MMSILKRFYITALVMRGALLPPRRGGGLPGVPDDGMVVPPGYLPVPAEQITRYLANLGRAVGRDGKLALFFPGCGALAAPFLLFRLKREGFSNCTAIATVDGLLMEAWR